MAYFGKEFKFEKEENYEEFIKALASIQEIASTYLSYKPNQTLLKNGDEYTLVFTVPGTSFKKEITFKSGVQFEEEFAEGALKGKSVITVDGDTFTQVQDFGNGTVTIKREYSATQIKTTVSSTFCGGTAFRYYVAA